MKKILCMLLSAQVAYGTVVVQGNAAAALNTQVPVLYSNYNINGQLLTFSQQVTAKAFDRTNGVLYVGLSNEQEGTAPSQVLPVTFAPPGSYLISKVVRTPGGVTPSFIPIATNTNFFPAGDTLGIDFLALATTTGNLKPNVVVVQNEIVNGTAYYLGNPNIIICSNDGSIVQGYTGVLAYNPVVSENGPLSAGIVQLAANEQFIFAAVRPNNISSTSTSPAPPNSLCDFGTPSAQSLASSDSTSGIAVLGFNPVTLFPSQLSAQPNDTGIKAARLDDSTPEVVIQGTPVFVPNRASLTWDDQLQRLYIGLQLATAVPPTTSPSLDGDGAQSIVVGQVSPTGALTYYNFMSSAATAVLPNGAATYITAVRQVADDPQNLAAAHVNIMHSSGGGSYLILEGGNGTLTDNAVGVESNTAPITPTPLTSDGTIGNMIFALPLVDMQNPADPTQGTLAAKNDPTFNTLKRFTTPATTLDDLTTSADPAALVGAGPLPVQPSTPISGAGGGIFAGPSGLLVGADTLDLTVVDDTVYVALANQQTSTLDDTGIFYSQAMFDAQGKIASWTPWAKRALPFDAFPKLSVDNYATRWVDVDPVTGKVWAVDGDYLQTVVTTVWQSGQFLSPLPNAVNSALSTGCFSVLDLDQNTSGLGAATPYRYGLFGGMSTVAFAVTNLSKVPNAPFNQTNDYWNFPPISTTYMYPAAQEPLTDYTTNQNFLVTQLPTAQNVGVNVLEYSRQTAGTTNNYFFAGTDLGLFVFAQPGGAGFDVSTLSTLNAAPFSTGTWQQAPNISGAIVDMKTTGAALYIVTKQTSSAGSSSAVYLVPFADTVGSMFANPTIIAQTGVGSLGGTSYFYGIQIISEQIVVLAAPYTEQLVLATNNGLFMSNAIGGIENATNQTDAAWSAISPDGGVTQYFGGIAGIDTPTPNTVWPFSVQDPTKQGLYDRSSIYQVSGPAPQTVGTPPAPFIFDPYPFNANVSTPPFVTLDPINYFWSDGARRLFVITPEQPCSNINNRVMALPYNVVEWNVKQPRVLADPVLDDVSKIFWIKNIGSTGIIMAGVENGVIALE